MNDSVYAYTIEQEEEQPYLDPVKLSFVISGYAQELNIAVETNQESWTYDLGDASTWLTERSKDNSSLVLSVAENKSGEVRNARIKIWSVLHRRYSPSSPSSRTGLSKPLSPTCWMWCSARTARRATLRQ